MTKKTKGNEQDIISSNNHFNIINILLLDHSYLKECIQTLKSDKQDKKIKFKYAKGFLDALRKHSAGEKKALYAPLEEVENLRSLITKCEIEHGIFDKKVKNLANTISGMRVLTEEMDAELKVLAKFVENHLKEEERDLFPKMRKNIDRKILNQMGYQFMILRQFSEKDLADSPDLKEEMPYIKKTAIPVGKFLNTTHEYFSSGGHR